MGVIKATRTFTPGKKQGPLQTCCGIPPTRVTNGPPGMEDKVKWPLAITSLRETGRKPKPAAGGGGSGEVCLQADRKVKSLLVSRLLGKRSKDESQIYFEASPEPREMSARFAGWSVFRRCFAAFGDLILHCWLRQRRQRTASPSQAYFSLSLSLSFPSSQREGRKCSAKN